MDPQIASFSYALDRDKPRKLRRREGRYLLRINPYEHQPEKLSKFYIQLTEIEAAFKNLKGDLEVRPIFHQTIERIEAHIFVAFLAYSLHVTLRARLGPLASGLTPRAVLDKFAAIQMLDAHFPTTERSLVSQLNLEMPQPPPSVIAVIAKPPDQAL